jgi:hypothetical protein
VLPLKDDNPTVRTTWVTIVFIVINVVVFVGPQSMDDPKNTERDVTLEFAAIPCEAVSADGLTNLEINERYTGSDDRARDLDTSDAPRFPNKPERLAVVFSINSL